MSVKALILSAGMGTRLGELTRDRPKPLLPLQGTPLLGWTLKHLASHGIRDVAINVHYLADMITSAIGDGSRYGAHVHYEREPALLGTAGSVRNLAKYFGDASAIMVVYGDILFDEDLGAMLEFHRARAASATLMVHRRRGSNSRLTLDAEQRIVAFAERPSEDAPGEHWVNSGIQILHPALLERIPSTTPADLPKDVYVPLLASERIYGYPLTGYRCAIDSPERYRTAEDAVRTGKLRWR